MQVAMVAAGFSANEADQLRRAMATFKFTGGVNKFKDKLIQGMIDNGYDIEFANRTFRQLEGFGSYGFPESHAASFALIAYASSWMKCHHPDVFCAAILNAQPMGFYEPSQLVRDARSHGVEIRPIDVNKSSWDCSLEADRRKVSRRPAWPAHDARSLRKRRQLSCRSARRAALSDHPRTRAARGARDRRAGAAGEGGRLCLVGAFTQARRRGPSKGCETRRCRSSRQRSSELRRLCRSRSRKKSRFPL